MQDRYIEKALRSSLTDGDSSNLSITPQGPTSESPTTLTLKIPPQTGESRQAVIQKVKVVSQNALEEIKRARHVKHDQLRKMKADRSLRSDDYQKAHDQMESLVQKSNGEVKRIADGARRVFEG
jgi:ribosome recycling factor